MSLRTAVLAVLLLSLPTPVRAQRHSLAPAPGLLLEARVAEITGTPVMWFPVGTSVGNLHGPALAAGFTGWDPEGTGLFLESKVGYLWEARGETRVFEVPRSQFLDDNVHFPLAIADDGTTVGWNVFSVTLAQLPFRWTRQAGFEFLATPAAGWNGQAVAVSADGQRIAGWLGFGLAGLPQAVRWVNGELGFLAADPYSRAFAIARDGRVIVGEAGPDLTTTRATSWVDGVEAPLDAVPGATSSTARLVSGDGRVVFGQADVGGRRVLARWRSAASREDGLRTFTPPNGLSVVSIEGTNRTGSAVVGALDTLPVPLGRPANDRVPFLWRARQGFTLLGERGLAQDYDYSHAVAVSDDGTRVAGVLQATSVFQGFPPQTAFLWTAHGGTASLDELLEAGGVPARGLYDVAAMSPDGRRLIATGTTAPSEHDSPSVLLELEPAIVESPLR